MNSVGRRLTSYLTDMAALNALPFDHYLRATETVAEMLGLTGRLIESGNAYESNGSVYFSVSV